MSDGVNGHMSHDTGMAAALASVPLFPSQTDISDKRRLANSGTRWMRSLQPHLPTDWPHMAFHNAVH